MIQLYCGDGKGKTTAAVGAAVRAAGRGRFVLFAQFMKGQESGELFLLRNLDQIRVLRSDCVFPFYRDMTKGQKKELRRRHDRMLEEIGRALSEKEADFAVLDEITHACRLEMVDMRLLEQVLHLGKGTEREIVLTGRRPPPRLVEISDYISEIENIRHPFAQGICARVGVER